MIVYTCLPVRRELKPINIPVSINTIAVYTCLPVRRELKLNLYGAGFVKLIFVYTCLPVRRELKLCFITSFAFLVVVFTRAFPFVGN